MQILEALATNYSFVLLLLCVYIFLWAFEYEALLLYIYIYILLLSKYFVTHVTSFFFFLISYLYVISNFENDSNHFTIHVIDK